MEEEDIGHSRIREAKKIQESIRDILLRDWDPLGVAGIPEAQEEYDSYIAPVYRILTDAPSEDRLVDFLYWTERDTMGLPGSPRQQLGRIARRLLALDVRLR